MGYDFITSTSYNILFVFSFIVILLLLGLSAFSYDQFNKASNKNLKTKDASFAKTMGLIGVTLSLVFILILLILYFTCGRQLEVY